MSFNYFSKNGEIMPLSEATIPLSSIEYSYGFGVYESLRVVNGITYFINEHIERLYESARIIGLEHPFSPDEIELSITALVAKNQALTCNVKILLIGGSGRQDAQIFIQCLNPLFPDRKLYRDGTSLITYQYERAFPHAKTLNMLQSYLAYREAKKTGAYDALLINQRGEITEGTRTNFFVIKDKTIYTPPENEILLGVTRKILLTVALNNGYRIREKTITKEEVEHYDGAFISSTSTGIMPIKSLDGYDIHQSNETKVLMKLFEEFVKNSNGKL